MTDSNIRLANSSTTVCCMYTSATCLIVYFSRWPFYCVFFVSVSFFCPKAPTLITNYCVSWSLLHITDPPNTTVFPTLIIINSSSADPIFFTCESFGIPPPSISWIQVRTNTTLSTFRDVEVSPDEKTVNSTVSRLTIHNPTDPDESNYTCVAVNDITNVLGTPETATAELYVQGTLRVLLRHPSVLQQHMLTNVNALFLPSGSSVVLKLVNVVLSRCTHACLTS